MRYAVPFLMALTLVVAMPLLVAFPAITWPEQGDLAIALVPPWHDAEQIVSEAGGWMIGAEASQLAVLVTSDQVGFFMRLRAAGALLYLDPAMMSDICGAYA